MAGIGRRALALAAGTLAVPRLARGQSDHWPTRTIRLIVPFPPGNAGDIAARLLSDELARRLGQAVVVDNRAGASGAIGIQAVIQSPPDGHTLLVTSLSPLSIAPALARNLPYDPERDLLPVALIGWTSMMLVASPEFPARDVAGVVNVLRAEPGRHSFAHLGPGTLSHLTQELFRVTLGLQVEGVPYRGSGQALMDMSANRIPLMFDGMTSALAQVQAGRVKGIAVSSARRSAFARDIPTLAESGLQRLDGFEVLGWNGLLAPRGTPRAVVERVNAAVADALRDPAVTGRFGAQALEAFAPASPDEFAAYLRADLVRWQRVVRDANIRVET